MAVQVAETAAEQGAWFFVLACAHTARRRGGVGDLVDPCSGFDLYGELINSGVSIEVVRRRLGHASTETTQLYTLLADEVADAEIRAARRRRTAGR